MYIQRAFTVSVLLASLTSAAIVTPNQWLQAQTKPVFKAGHTLPLLSQMHCSLPPVDVRLELAGNWGYAVHMDHESQLVAACNSLPSKYKASGGIGNLGNESQNFPAGSYLKNADGTDVVTNGRKIMSLEASDAAFRSTMINVGLAKVAAQLQGVTQPVGLIANWTEYMPTSQAYATYSVNDAAVLAAKGSLTWDTYITRRLVHYDSLMRASVKAVYPSAFYAAYTYQYGPPMTDLPSPECYFNYFNKGYSTSSGDMFTKILAEHTSHIASGNPYYYGWLSAGYERNIADYQGDITQPKYSDLPRWMGYLKMSYTIGMLGGITTGEFGCGIPYTSFDGNNPPKWLDQMAVLGHAHALFSWLEPILRTSDLLPGPTNKYEFPTAFGKKTRVVARKLQNADRWLISAWAMDSVEREATVTIPILGDYTILARPCGTVCLVGKIGTTPTTIWFDENGMNPSLTASTLDTAQTSSNPNIILIARPAFSIPGGIYGSAQTVSITCETQGADVRYTTNGTDPTTASPVFSTGISVTGATTIKARAFKTGLKPSQIATATYQIFNSAPANLNFVNGVKYKYYEGTWTSMPNFNALTPVSQGMCDNISINLVTHRAENYAIEFTGYIEMPRDGIYTFSTMSDDGSRLFLSNNLMVNNDGARTTMARVAGTPVWIKSGVKFPITVQYFVTTGFNYLLAEWEPAGSSLVRIPQQYLYYSLGTAVQPKHGILDKTMQHTKIITTENGYSIRIAEQGAHNVKIFNVSGRLAKEIYGKGSSSYFIPTKELTPGVNVLKIAMHGIIVSRTIVVY